jgi:hypothetical protein
MKYIYIIPFLIMGLSSMAQTPDSTSNRRAWYKPDHFKLQYAGNIGFLSGGPGYISKNKTLETDLLIGYLPKKFGGDALITSTLKTTYSPWRISLSKDRYLVPFSIGAYLSHTFGPQFDSKWPSYYPAGYYWWATAIRPGAYIGGKIGSNNLSKKSQVELYYELGSYDLMMISYVQNTHYLNLTDILNLAIGVKISLHK